ncbi:glycosyltransferase family 2 protein [Chryseobacterium hagamense]|uniref:Glycosyltransferase 2-like domain-containing protein n=1 Tax=Chryseobacterium hagamense TaxID=395935 RepID=A0A511YLT8_9FLAO|nr:glycosyltransferase [Chryseobacterium hagamense]GEN76168.1 hypothetical protein CHA01nite_19080 [Chryseobacterium hagamense]
MNLPILSIIVPIYNVEMYLKECIDSILNQDFNDFELILVNDGSPDNCGEICDNYALLDNRIKVIHKVNGGLSSARNSGIEIARGEYLSFIDSDDFISEDYYLKNMEYLNENNDVDMLVLQVCHYDGNKNRIVKNIPQLLQDKDSIFNYLLSMNYIGAAWLNIYKKKIFNTIRYPEGSIYEDGYILPDIIQSIKKLYLSNVGIYYYRNRENSIMTKKKSLGNWNDILKTHKKQLDFCYSLNDNKQLFLEKYIVCHLAIIYASLEFSSADFNEFIVKFENYDYTLSHLLRSKMSSRNIVKLYLLKKLGFKNIITLYKILK